ncbi:MAG: hypothetical protein WA317_19100 [Mycobacterium sp.]|uniref:hypothetical protein n=1 Tax=Mycobacterium sp. TaxID=1785 RepID=UPI003CC682F8
MVTPAAPHSRSTSAALASILARVVPRVARGARVVNDMVVFRPDLRVSGRVLLASLRYPPRHDARTEPGGPGRLAGQVWELAVEPLTGNVELNHPHSFAAYLVPAAPAFDYAN